MTVRKKLRELLISVTYVLFYTFIYLYSFCFSDKNYKKEELKAIQTF